MMEISPTHSPIRVLPVSRPQHQREQEQVHPVSRKTTRPKSPSQKIPRNHSSRSIDIPSANQYEYEMDENGHPKPDMTGHTCFSYRTMQKQYEKDTQRMLERIQKSRSFETSQTNLQQQQQLSTSINDIAQRSVSLMDLASIADEASRNCYYDGGFDDGFYIGDEGCDENVGSCLDHLRQMNQPFEDDQDEIFELDL
uniref:Uncharacterized protein n=1 Tax=Pseudo-nitzschia delicatissima TaxID=44447 RepID=A0A7S0TB35_9STRA|mmetsp:Transcript_1474/g.3414  ORF Transcript_1474/g.3414 Transcript_1474/m.3414 type:complete len:197 (+) Transcript_1474:152-742(+)